MRLKDELIRYPEKVKKKLKAYTQNYCALILASQADVTPEEAFLSLDQEKVYKFIRHEKYTTDDIYQMFSMKEQGKTLEDIAKYFEINPAMVWKVLEVYKWGGTKVKYVSIKKTITKTFEVQQVGLDYCIFNEFYREIRKNSRYPGFECFKCEHRFDEGEKLSLAITSQGNKVLCRKCAEEVQEKLKKEEAESEVKV